jgi:hypothetical protein
VRSTTAEALKKEADETHADAKNRKNHAGRLQRTSRIFEPICLNTFWVGVLFLAVFAAVNVVLGAGHHFFK